MLTESNEQNGDDTDEEDQFEPGGDDRDEHEGEEMRHLRKLFENELIQLRTETQCGVLRGDRRAELKKAVG